MRESMREERRKKGGRYQDVCARSGAGAFFSRKKGNRNPALRGGGEKKKDVRLEIARWKGG